MEFVKPCEPGKRPLPAERVAAADTAGRVFGLVHLSDSHLLGRRGLTAADWRTKRALGYLSWRLKHRRGRRPPVAAALGRAVGALPADAVAVTGDVTHLGRAADFDAAAELLGQLGGPQRVFLVPGNHDAYRQDALRNARKRLAGYLPPEGRAPWPYLRTVGPLALVGLSSAVPTPPLMATGRLGEPQLQRLAEVLAQTAAEGLFRVLLVHHPPVAGLASRRRRLTDRPALAGVLRRLGAELVLHGHTHEASATVIDGPAGPIPVLGVPAITAQSDKPQRRAAFNYFGIRPAGGHWQAEWTACRWDGEGAFVPAETKPLEIPASPAA